MYSVAVCDDMPILADMIIKQIREYGLENGLDIQADSFLSGEDFLKRFRLNPTFYGLIFLDNKMAGLTGAQTAMYIRQLNTDCKIVFVTSDVNNYNLYQSESMAVLEKPAKKEDVYNILDKVIKRE